MPEPNTELIVPVLINGAVFATVAVIVPAFLLSRFTRDIVGRSVLVIFLFIAAGAYFGFATSGREVLGTGQVWLLVELVQVVGFGTLALLVGDLVPKVHPGPASHQISCLPQNYVVSIKIAHACLDHQRLFS